MKSNDHIRKLRYIYILVVNNMGIKSRYYGHRSVLYIGQTDNLTRRISEHLKGINSAFIKKNFPNSTKRLVYVEQVEGTFYDLLDYEIRYKRYNKPRKIMMIDSIKNQLIKYIPGKAIILKHHKDPAKQVALRF